MTRFLIPITAFAFALQVATLTTANAQDAKGKPAATKGKAAGKSKGKGKGTDAKPAAASDTPSAQPAPDPTPLKTEAKESQPTTGAEKVEASPLTGGDSDQSVQMRGLEERVNDLKEKIFRSKARLMLLRETVLSGAIAGARATLVHRNEMGSAFVLESVSYALDGAPIYTKTDKDGDLSDREEIEVFNGSIVPGNHNLSVNLVYRGSGFGIFSYFQGYKFRIRSSYAFTAEEGKVTNVKIVGYEKGGFTTDLEDRPAVRYDVDVKSDNAAESTPSAAAPAQAPAAAPAATGGELK